MYIQSVKIEGLWGYKTFVHDFFKNVNVFIGNNGSGKTTIMRIISAALTGNYSSLIELPFSSVEVKFSSPNSRAIPQILVKKEGASHYTRGEIAYIIKQKATGKVERYIIRDTHEFPWFRNRPELGIEFGSKSRTNDVLAGLQCRLKDFVNVAWLSTDRGLNAGGCGDGTRTAIDMKLEEFQDLFNRYCLNISRQESIEQDTFRKRVFNLFLASTSLQRMWARFVSLDFEVEKESLREVYAKFGAGEHAIDTAVEKFFRRVVELRSTIDTSSALKAADVVALSDATKVSSVLSEWKRSSEKISALFKCRIAFFSALDSMFKGKTLTVNEKNEIVAKLSPGKTVGIFSLSSGEKQMIILLGQALLADNEAITYIVDEPELSLHVDWQEALIQSILGINPKAQIVFATHSPDIVGGYDDNVCDVQEAIS